MNALINVQRKATIALIVENPIAIVIRRKTYVLNAATGGREEQIIILPAFTGRIVPSKHQPKKIAEESGVALTSAYILIAPWNANVRADSDILDSFNAGNKEYRIVRVIPRKYGELTYSIHAVLEEVS